MKVLLVSPSSPFLVDARTFPPLGLLYLGAALEANGHEVKVIDLAFAGSIRGDVVFDPQLVGIMCLTPHYPAMPKLIADVRATFAGAVVVGGGAHFSTRPSDGAVVGLDATCVGDGEEAIVAMLDDLQAGRQLKPIYQSTGGIVDVDKYPIPARHLLPIHDYRYSIAGLKATTVMTQRGCLAAGTPVALSSGQQRFIEDVKKGDYVLSYNPEMQRCESAPVQAIWGREANDLWELTWQDGTILRVTGEHPVWTQRGWVEVHHLKTQRDCALMQAVQPLVLRAKESSANSCVLPPPVSMGVATSPPQSEVVTGRSSETQNTRGYHDINRTFKVLGASSDPNQGHTSRSLTHKAGASQSNETARSGRKGVGHFETTLGEKSIRLTESTLEIGAYASPLGKVIRQSTEQIGALTPRTVARGGTNVSLRRRWAILDWALRLWQAAQSRLHRYSTQTSNPSSWGVLALTTGGLYRTDGLSWVRLDSPCGVVSSDEDQESCAPVKKTDFVWQKLISSRFIGASRVYNITVHPVHTYLANGIVVHNCPYECTFCCHWEGYRKVRLRHTDNIVSEVRMLKSQGYGGVMFYDDEFNLVPKRTLEVCDALKGEGIRWRAFVKANIFTEEQAKAMADSGCWELCTGVESGSDVILRTIKKKATVADNTMARRLCRDYGIRFKAFTMVGHPGESLETAYATRDWLIANQPDEFNLSLYTPYLGTPVHDNPSAFDIKFDALDYGKEEFFYRGKPGEYQAHASTSALSGEQLARLRDEIEDEVREKLGLPKQASPATYYNTARTPDVATTEVG